MDKHDATEQAYKNGYNDGVNSQKSELEKKDIEIGILIRKKESLKDEIAELQAEIEKLKQNLNEAHIDIKEHMAEIERLRNILVTAYKRLDNLLKEMTEDKQ